MTRRCKVCRIEFDPRLPMQTVCSPDCALSFAQSKRMKAVKRAQIQQRKEDKVRREKLKSRRDWEREAQQAFNAWVRLRDAGRPCISCGRKHGGQMHAGHYLSVGAHPEMRFEPLNVWAQCAPCNTYLSGNAVAYRQALVREIGEDKVQWLEGPHEPKKYTVEQLQAIRDEYRRKVRELKRGNECIR